MVSLSSSNLENLNHDELLQTTRRLLAEADALSSRIAAVNEIGVAINQTLDLSTILRVVAKQAKWLLDFQYCSVCLKEDEKWVIRTLFGAVEPEIDNLTVTENLGKTLVGGQPQLIRTGTTASFLAGYQSQIIIPLSAANRLLGTINFATKEAEKYTQDDMRIGYMLSLQISSALRNAEVVRELQATEAELQLRIEDLDAYNHTIAHDLKSPLSSILLNAQLLQAIFGNTMPEKAVNYVASIHNSTMQMNRMIDQLLWLAKLRQFNESLETVQVQTVVQNAVSRFTHLIQQQNITLTIAPDMPPALAYAQWVEEIFANFISNAIKYMGQDHSQPAITIRAKRNDKLVRYEVQDNGIGIKPEDQLTLFEMFARVENSEVEGVGLGLSIVRRIIQRMNGKVGVESTYGVGSTFWFELSCGDSVKQPQAGEEDTQHGGGETESLSH